MMQRFENHTEKQSSFKIDLPEIGDEFLLAPMHIQAWKESYITPESGLTQEMIDELLAPMLVNTDFRKNTISEAIKNPEAVLYRVVRNDSGIVGFLHGSKHDDYNELDGIYLLNEAKGSGIGKKLMDEFLLWADKNKPCHLEVFSFNEQAIKFYINYGFIKTEKPIQMWRDTLPFIEMVRPIEE